MLSVIVTPKPVLTRTNAIFVERKQGDFAQLTNGSNTGFYKILEHESIKPNEIALNMFQRDFLRTALKTEIVIDYICCPDPLTITITPQNSIKVIKFMAKMITRKDSKFEINNDVLADIKSKFNLLPMNNSQTYSYENILSLTVCEITMSDLFGVDADTSCQNLLFIVPETIIVIVAPNDNNIDIITDCEPGFKSSDMLFKGEFDFKQMGIGGLDKQFEIVFRRAFSSRLIPDNVLKNLGINHVRGIMLHGPPGCGKTLIARQIGKILNCHEPKIVTGPSLLSSFMGKSEENVRLLFEDAIADKKGKKLHLIILDEFDSIGKRRGNSGPDSSVMDKIVNQFLAMIDGPESLNNVLLIAMTNRLDFIDEALLRPGRFEIQIEITLPDTKGRFDILQIHTQKMLEANYLNSDVVIEEIADQSKNFTGAELEGLVKNAVSYAMSRELDPKNMSSISSIVPNIKQSDFVKAIGEIIPQFGQKSDIIDIVCSKQFIHYSSDYSSVYTNIDSKISNVMKKNPQNYYQF